MSVLCSSSSSPGAAVMWVLLRFMSSRRSFQLFSFFNIFLCSGCVSCHLVFQIAGLILSFIQLLVPSTIFISDVMSFTSNFFFFTASLSFFMLTISSFQSSLIASALPLSFGSIFGLCCCGLSLVEFRHALQTRGNRLPGQSPPILSPRAG